MTQPPLPPTRSVSFTVNGSPVTASVEPRRTLLDCLRDDLVLPGTHVGCEHGVCGCCNVIVDGALVRSCLMFAVQADGCSIETIEGVGGEGGGGETAAGTGTGNGPGAGIPVGTDSGMSPLQEAFCAHHAMQCGYCTPGMIMTLEDLLRTTPVPTDEQLLDAVSGNLCRCTGYQQILRAARSVVAARTV